MRRAVRLAALLLLATVAGCTAGATFPGAGPPPSSAARGSVDAVDAVDAGTDVGNGRPQVTHDGLMVRRRVVIAVLPTPGADVVSLREQLNRAAAGRHTTLTDISPSVLDPADQERLAPELTVLLPAGATVGDARRLIDPSTPSARAAFPDVQDYLVAPVLVHDLRFRVRATDPSAVAAAIAREGILADALGDYSTTARSGSLDVTYTGPLLSDELVEAVRRGIARGEGVEPSSVTVSPRSPTGAGVDLAKEPPPAPVVEVVTAPHGHGATVAASARVPGGSSQPNPWLVAAVVVVALAVGLRLALSLAGSDDEEAGAG
jgi:hypothetical protein